MFFQRIWFDDLQLPGSSKPSALQVLVGLMSTRILASVGIASMWYIDIQAKLSKHKIKVIMKMQKLLYRYIITSKTPLSRCVMSVCIPSTEQAAIGGLWVWGNNNKINNIYIYMTIINNKINNKIWLWFDLRYL